MNWSGFEPAFATASEAAEAVRQKIISASELIDITFQRIDRHNPKLNAIIWRDREAAMTRAKQLDEALAGGHGSGALHGVPVTIKESFAYRMTRGGREGNADAVAYPGQIDLWCLVHGNCGTARIAEDDFSAFDLFRHSHVVGGRHKTARVTVEHVVIARTVHINPT